MEGIGFEQSHQRGSYYTSAGAPYRYPYTLIRFTEMPESGFRILNRTMWLID
jgi:hypothetical protein